MYSKTISCCHTLPPALLHRYCRHRNAGVYCMYTQPMCIIYTEPLQHPDPRGSTRHASRAHTSHCPTSNEIESSLYGFRPSNLHCIRLRPSHAHVVAAFHASPVYTCGYIIVCTHTFNVCKHFVVSVVLFIVPLSIHGDDIVYDDMELMRSA